MDRMFPQPVNFVKVDTFVIKDTKCPYDRYWNFDEGKWTGLLLASRLTKEEMSTKQNMPENGVMLKRDEVLGIKNRG